jgi:preprotein translocase subunit SecG
MQTLFLVIHILITISLVTLILLQQGQGSAAGSGFGGGASSTVFGARGSATFLSRITAGLATGFFLTSLTLAYFATQVQGPASIVERSGLETIELPAEEEPAEEPANLPPTPEDVPRVPQ